MARTNPLGVRVEPEIKEALERAANADDRSVSSLVERILKTWLQDNKWLETPKPLELHVRFVSAQDGSVTDGPKFTADPSRRPRKRT